MAEIMEFQKGIFTSNGFIKEGSFVKATTIQGVVVEGTLVTAAKKKIGIQLEGEIETRLFDLESITKLVNLDDCDCESEDDENGFEEQEVI